MEFRILGPLEVVHEGQTLPLGGAQQRALLALLLISRDEVVATERLIDELWGEHVPLTAAKTVQGYISNLRKVLTNGVIETRGRGYRLVVEPDDLDARRFETLVEEGREALAGGDAAGAAKRLRDALALWRGPPLAGFEYEDWAQPERSRLEELRLLALEERVEAELRQDGAGRLVPELRSLVAEYPLRERIRAQLMLALYRSGRQAEALETYAEIRRRLIEELGIEPGHELQALQRQVLAQDPALGVVRRPWPLVGSRGRRRLFVAGALLLTLAAAATVIQLTGSSEAHVAPNSVASLAVLSGGLRSQVALPAPDTDMAIGGGSVWALSGDTGTITQLDAKSGRLVSTFAAGTGAVDIVFGGGFLWVLASGSPAPAAAGGAGSPATVVQIDPQSRAIMRTIKLPLGPPGSPVTAYLGHLPGAHLLAWAAGSLWVTDPGESVDRVDPGTGRIVSTVPGILSHGLEADGDAVWVMLDVPGTATFERIDARTGRPGATVRTPALARNAPFAFAVGGGQLWVPDGYTGLLYRITPGNPPIVRATPIGVGVGSVVYVRGGAWAGDEIHDTVARVDGASGQVTRIVSIPSPQSLATSSGVVWVGSGPGPSRTLPRSNCGPLLYGGPGSPRFLIVSDFALQGGATQLNLANAAAVRWVLSRDRFRAGRYTIGLQSCDDSTPQAGGFDFAKCLTNAQLYSKTPDLLGIVGTTDSPCTGEELPLLNQAPGGPIPIISPSNTFQSLTVETPANPPDILHHYYPTGIRNFLRVTSTDTHEMAADALLAHQLGLHQVLVVADDGTAGSQIHTPEFVQAASGLGLRTSQFLWHAEQQPAQLVVAAARRYRADGVFIAAGYPPRLAQLVAALRHTLGQRFPIIGTDYFQSGESVWQTAGGRVATGTYVSTMGVFNHQLPAAGQRFLRAFGTATPSLGAPYAAQATEALLNAIARSNGTRAAVLRQLFRTKISQGIVGSISFNSNGDLVDGPITILRLQPGPSPNGDPALANTVVDRIITPPPQLVP